MIRRFSGVGIAGTPGDRVLVVMRRDLRLAGGQRGVLALHGHGQDATIFAPGFPALGAHTLALVEAGFVVVSIDAGGDLWGNCMGIIDAAHTWMTGALGCKPSKIGMLGYSMSGLSVLNYVKRHAAKVAAALLIDPAIDLAYFHGIDPYRTEIDAAYGGLYALNAIGFNPAIDVTTGGYTGLGVPLTIRHVAADEVAPVDHSQTFVALAADSNVTLRTYPTGTHGLAGTAFSPSDTAAFFAANAA